MSGENLVPNSFVSNVTGCELQIWVSLDGAGAKEVAIIALEGDVFGQYQQRFPIDDCVDIATIFVNICGTGK